MVSTSSGHVLGKMFWECPTGKRPGHTREIISRLAGKLLGVLLGELKEVAKVREVLVYMLRLLLPRSG